MAAVLLLTVALIAGCKPSMKTVSETTDPAELAEIALRTDISEFIAKGAVDKLSDQAQLARLASEAERINIRLAAVGKLTDQSVLARLATEAPRPAVRTVAIYRLTDQEALARVAREDKIPRLRRLAARKITDPDALTRMGMWVKPEHTRQVEDQELLKRIAEDADAVDVRIAAVERVEDQEFLARLAARDPEDKVRKVAAERVTDAAILAAQGMWFKPKLARQVTDQTLLAELAQNAAMLHVRLIAVSKLTDQDLLERLAVNGRPFAVSKEAAATLTDNERLERIVKQKENPILRATAVASMTDQDLLKRHAFDTTVQLREAAVKNESLTDQATLARVAAEDKSKEIRLAAIKRLTDQAQLAASAVGDPWLRARKTAVERLTDTAFLAQVVDHGLVRGRILQLVRLKALERVDDQELLKTWSLPAQDRAIREAAVVRVTDVDVLVARLRDEPSADVRERILDTLERMGAEALTRAATEAYHRRDRLRAVWALEKMQGERSPAVVSALAKIGQRASDLVVETDNSVLMQTILHGEFDTLRIKAASHIPDQAMIEMAALEVTDTEVLKVLLWRLRDQTAIERIAAKARSPGMRLAAAKRAHDRSWEDLFKTPFEEGGEPPDLGAALDALKIFGSSIDKAKAELTAITYGHLARGDERFILETIDLFHSGTTIKQLEFYLNCGHPELAAAAASFAYAKGYTLNTVTTRTPPGGWGGN